MTWQRSVGGNLTSESDLETPTDAMVSWPSPAENQVTGQDRVTGLAIRAARPGGEAVAAGAVQIRLCFGPMVLVELSILSAKTRLLRCPTALGIFSSVALPNPKMSP